MSGEQHLTSTGAFGADAAVSSLETINPARERLLGDPIETTAHRGVRLHEFWSEDGVHYTAVRESIETDGHGRFNLQFMDALTPTIPKSPDYELIKNSRAGFEFRYSGFRVRHRSAFARNWNVEDTGMGVVLNGRPCLTFRVWRPDHEGDSYLLRVDELNDFILQEERFNKESILVERRSYQVVDFNPNLTGTAWHMPSRPEVDLDSSLDLDQQTGFEVRAPRYVPEGFRPFEVQRIDDPTSGVWSKLVYSDGVQLLIVLQQPMELDYVASHNNQPTSVGTPTVTQDIFVRGADPVAGDQVFFGEFGSISFSHGELQGREMFLIGHFSAETVLDVLESTLR